MLTTRNSTFGANFDYTNDNNCTASGEYRCENGVLRSVNINGQYVDGETSYNFFAGRDEAGNINLSGIPADVVAAVAAAVALIIAEVEAATAQNEE